MKVFCSIALFALALPVFAQTAAPAASKPKSTAPAATAKPKPAVRKPSPAKAAQSNPPASSASDSKTVLTVGTEKVSADDFEAFIEALPEQYKAQAQGPMKRQIAQELARVKLLAAEARRRGLDKDRKTQNRIAFQTENMLAGAVFSEIMKSAPVDTAAVRKYYDDHKNEYEEAQARHVLIRFKGSPAPLRAGKTELSDEEALAKVQELRKKIVGGEDFAVIARAESDDAGSGANGGDLGTFKRGMMVEAFDKAAFNQPIGEVSEPIKTQFGYHLVQVQKRESKSFEEARPQIEEKIRPEAARGAVESMVQSANVVYDDSYFGPAQAPAAAPGKPPVQTQPDNKK
jgi:peptidyl-prolyl cis-trans isomerase C